MVREQFEIYVSSNDDTDSICRGSTVMVTVEVMLYAALFWVNCIGKKNIHRVFPDTETNLHNEFWR